MKNPKNSGKTIKKQVGNVQEAAGGTKVSASRGLLKFCQPREQTVGRQPMCCAPHGTTEQEISDKYCVSDKTP